MKLTIHEHDVRPELCQRCAACCRIRLKVNNTDHRYRILLRTAGFDIIPRPQAGNVDCCADVHDIEVDMGFCRHLKREVSASGVLFSCGIHETAEYPALCRDFNCVSWAKCSNQYNEQNELLAQAERALQSLPSDGSRKAHTGAAHGEPTALRRLEPE